jgi:glutamine synthetase adenylyltransferase
MRLRPWGRVGPLTPTVEGYLRYLWDGAWLWRNRRLPQAVRPPAMLG